jgi:hypothetical protein
VSAQSTVSNMKLSAVEQKFLLRLLEQPHHRALITTIQPNPKTSAADRDRICRKLAKLGLVDYTYEVARFAITPAGKTLLKLDRPRAVLPVTPTELEVLRACAWDSIAPERLRKVPEGDRQRIIQALANRKLIKILEGEITEIWLMDAGQSYLENDRL